MSYVVYQNKFSSHLYQKIDALNIYRSLNAIFRMLPKARVVYCSATGVTDVKNMASNSMFICILQHDNDS